MKLLASPGQRAVSPQTERKTMKSNVMIRVKVLDQTTVARCADSLRVLLQRGARGGLWGQDPRSHGDTPLRLHRARLIQSTPEEPEPEPASDRRSRRPAMRAGLRGLLGAFTPRVRHTASLPGDDLRPPTPRGSIGKRDPRRRPSSGEGGAGQRRWTIEVNEVNETDPTNSLPCEAGVEIDLQQEVGWMIVGNTGLWYMNGASGPRGLTTVRRVNTSSTQDKPSSPSHCSPNPKNKDFTIDGSEEEQSEPVRVNVTLSDLASPSPYNNAANVPGASGGNQRR
ncbi:hypothetical protein EYF80_056013 [Liparis tanakae]|uniref:Uncharacterized protein n=1 Tax=Liparis tanakae TaxID=230148 RepID=A0A4Z2EXY8_9TELE|nr:hypothetical protein EYF80_056013 [Liparis tanakae]